MLCAACSEEIGEALAECPACGASPLLDERYRLDAVLAQGAFGVTYRATRLADDRAVCVKELVYRRMGSFDVEERFRREAGILEQLDHPQVPNYVDDFVSGDGKTLGLYLVQELVEGESLAQELEHHRYDEKEVLAVALLSRQDPADLVGDDNELGWRSAINVGAGAKALLATLLEPVPARRASDAGRVAKRARELIDSDVEKVAAPVPVTRERPPGEPDALRSRSRAEQPPASRYTALLGGIGLAVVAAGILFTALRDRPARVPHGLAGVEFGMTEAMVKDEIPGLEPAPNAIALGVAADDEAGPPRLKAKALLFDEPATCTFTFAVSDTLSKIDCLVDPLPNRAAHQRTLRKLLITLRKLYDTESSVSGETWTWKNPEARLWVRSDFEEQTPLLRPTAPKSVIEVANTWSEHDKAASKQYLERSERQAAKREAERAAEEARRAKERAAETERLRRRARSDGGAP